MYERIYFSDLGMDDEGDDDPVPLPNVNAAILKKVVKVWKRKAMSFSILTDCLLCVV